MTILEIPLGSKTSHVLARVIEDRFEQSVQVPESFFSTQADQIAQACWQMARRFHQGGRLIAFGNGAFASDAQHVSVEFVHPVIVGKRALPAIALTNDGALVSRPSMTDERGMQFARQLSMIARGEDIAMSFSMDGSEGNILKALEEAKRLGLLTVGMTGQDGGDLALAGLDFCFIVPSQDVMAVQETHETLYHILWELVHVFFEHEGLLT